MNFYTLTELGIVCMQLAVSRLGYSFGRDFFLPTSIAYLEMMLLYSPSSKEDNPSFASSGM